MALISSGVSDLFQIASDVMLKLTVVVAPLKADFPIYKSVIRSFSTLVDVLVPELSLTL